MVNGDTAEREIRACSFLMAVVRFRGAPEALRIVRPCWTPLRLRTSKGGCRRFYSRRGRCYQSHAFKLGLGHPMAGVHILNRHGREIRLVLAFIVSASGQADGSAGGKVG